jgi:lysozyme
MAFKFDTRLKKGGAVLAALVALVGGAEGIRTVAYSDPVGVPTICYGETLGVKLGQTKTVAECRAMFSTRLVEFERGMVSCIKEPDRIPDKTYISLISFTYNVGVSGFCHSTLVKKINAGDLVGACNELPKWNKAGGHILKGLTIRRAKEQVLCLDGVNGTRLAPEVPKIVNPVPPMIPAPAPKTASTGWLIGIAAAIGLLILGIFIFSRRK